MTNLEDIEELKSLSPEERELALKILQEYSSTGISQSYNNIIQDDYKEIPVDIITFIKDPRYLGKAWHTSTGKCKLFPYWEEKLKILFPDPYTTAVNNFIESGARGLGKSEIAVTCGLYLMYRAMCLKNPLEHYNLKPTEKLTFAFMNITEALAYDIGVAKFQATVQLSPWFMERGILTGKNEIVWNPPDFIKVVVGSQPRHVIGQPILYCLDGDTPILTDSGVFAIKDLVDKKIKVPTINSQGNIEMSEECTVQPTGISDVEYEIELEDGTIIKCTPNHKFMLKDGSYKEAQYLTPEDELFDVQNSYQNINKVKIVINKLDNPKQYYDVINANPYNNFLIQTNSGLICSHNCFFDEISFIANQDIEKQKEKAIDMIDTAIGGMKTRFLNNGVSPALLVLASSKRSEKSFLEEHMKRKLETENENTLICDEPVWNVRPPSEYSGKRFYVGQGNKFLVSEVLPNDNQETIDSFRDRGYKVISVPIEYKANFLEDIDRALCDFAGVSSSDLTKYISANRLQMIKQSNLNNPFVKDIIEVGNALDDKTQYYDFFNMENVDPQMKEMPLFIHLDMSISGDKTGIAGVWIKGKKASIDNNANEMYYQLAFNVSIKAPKGYQISFAKNKEFIYWLKEQGFAIKGISSDTYQNASIAQDLIAKGYNYEVISVDRTNQDKICVPYQYLKSTIYDQRISMYDSPLLTEELLGLERNGNTGKVDHPDGGRYGSKDSADAVCGALYNASKHAEEFAFEYGETLDTIIQVSGESSYSARKQIEVDFEQELQRAFDPIKEETRQKIQKQDNDSFMDFGFGKATTANPFYLASGIII